MVAITVILMFIILLMSIVMVLDGFKGSKCTGKGDEKKCVKVNSLSDLYLPILGTVYQIIFGENPDLDDMTSTTWIVYFIITYFINITALNLLVAVLSNTFDNVQSSMDATHCRAKVDILNELQELMVWNRKYNELVYLHFVYPANEKLSVSSGQDEWVGKVRVILNRLSEVKNNQADAKKELKDVKSELKAELQSVKDEFRESKIYQQNIKNELMADLSSIKNILLKNEE